MIVNPDNLSPEVDQDEFKKLGIANKYFPSDGEVARNVPWMYQVFFGCYLFLAVCALTTVHHPSEESLKEIQLYEEQIKKEKAHALDQTLIDKPKSQCPDVMTGVRFYKF